MIEWKLQSTDGWMYMSKPALLRAQALSGLMDLTVMREGRTAK